VRSNGRDSTKRCVNFGRQHRCSTASTHPLSLATLNVCSLNNRTDVINQLMFDTPTDVLIETWHEDSDATCIRRLRTNGWQVIERARPIPAGTDINNLHFVNHGGVAVVAAMGIKVEKVQSVIEPVSFEHLIVKLKHLEVHHASSLCCTDLDRP